MNIPNSNIVGAEGVNPAQIPITRETLEERVKALESALNQITNTLAKAKEELKSFNREPKRGEIWAYRFNDNNSPPYFYIVTDTVAGGDKTVFVNMETGRLFSNFCAEREARMKGIEFAYDNIYDLIDSGELT